MNTLERKIDWLVALEEVRRVIALYARAGDANNDPLAMARLFTPDARWTCAGFGDFHGREVITRELARVGRERILWSLHYPVAPMVDVAEDRESAHAFWWLWELTTMRAGAEDAAPHWLAATYDADFIRAPDGWKIARLVLDIKQVVPYAVGAEQKGPP